MKTAILAGALGLALSSCAAFAQDPVYATPAGGPSSPIDRQFAVRAAASNTFEVRSSRIALRRSRDPRVRDLARWMIEAHTAAEAKLRASVAAADDAAPVETPDTAAMLTELAGLDGAAFDRAYVADQVAGHQLAARQMRDYAVQGSYAPLLRYEAATLPEVEAHLAHFVDLQSLMGPAPADDAAM